MCVLAPDRRVCKSQVLSYGNIWLHALYSVCCKWTILPAGKATRHIPSAKAVAAPSWAINAPNHHILKESSKIPIALCETEMRALPLSKMQAFFFFFLIFIYLLFLAVLGLRFVRGLSLVAASGGHSSSRRGGRSSSRCAGLSPS